MTVKQITIEIPNEPGQMAIISDILGEAGINILALFVSTKTPEGNGLIRFIADDPERAEGIMNSRGFEVSTQEVVAAETPHHAGGLLAVLNPLKRAKVNVEYLYPCIGTGEATILVLGVSKLEEAVDALQKDWIRLIGNEFYSW